VKTYQIEKAVVKHFNPRQNLIVPNVSWGFFTHHEADLLVCTKARCLYEIELKVTKRDLIAEKRKRWGHRDDKNRIKYLLYAVPADLTTFALEFIEERYGILSVSKRGYNYVVTEARKATKLSDHKVSDSDRQILLRLCALRLWGLKSKLGKLIDGGAK